MDKDSPYRVQVMRLSDIKPEDVPPLKRETGVTPTPPAAQTAPHTDTPPPTGGPIMSPGTAESQAGTPMKPDDATNQNDVAEDDASEGVGSAFIPPTAQAPSPEDTDTRVAPVAVNRDELHQTDTEQQSAPLVPPPPAALAEVSTEEAFVSSVPLDTDLRTHTPTVEQPPTPDQQNEVGAPQAVLEARAALPPAPDERAPDVNVAPGVETAEEVQSSTPDTTTRDTAPLPAWKPIPEPAPGSVPAAPTPGTGASLADLRNRVLHESSTSAFAQQTGKTLDHPDVRGLAAARKAKLAGTNIQALQEHVAADADTAQPTTLHERLAKKMIDSMGVAEANAPPTTEHARALADVAGNLNALQNNEQVTEADAHAPAPMVRTFRNDVENAIMHNKTSVVSALAAEENRRAKAASNNLRGHRKALLSPSAYLLIGMSIMLIVGGVVGVGAYFYLRGADRVVPQESIPSFIFLEKNEQLDVTGKTRGELVGQLVYYRDQADVRLGAITGLYPTIRTQNAQGGESVTLLDAPTFMGMLDTDAPQSLLRNLQKEMLIGIHEFDGNQPFFIFKTNAFQLVYAGMLEWENSMNLDLYPLFGPIVTQEPTEEVRVPLDVASTTASDTAPVEVPAAPASPGPRVATFEDTIVGNVEARVLRNAQGDIVLLWALPDPETLIITTNEYTLREIRERMTARTF